MNPTELAAATMLATALLVGCLQPFPPLAEQDFDKDDFTPSQGDCNDNDSTTHPEAVECDILGAPPMDNDCNGFVDGGGFVQSEQGMVLDWRDDFDGPSLEGWTSDRTLSDWAIRDGRLEQMGRVNAQLTRSDAAECWQDVEVELEVIPAPEVPELLCVFQLRSSGRAENDGVVDPQNYHFNLHHHTELMQGIGSSGHWDGWRYNYLARLGVDGNAHVLAGSDANRNSEPSGERADNYLGGWDPDNEPAWYVITMSAFERTDADGSPYTELRCSYTTDLNDGEQLCFPSDDHPIIDDTDDRPLTGGFSFHCEFISYTDLGQPEQQQGVAFEYIHIREAQP